jgi:hypothetical protein
VLPALPLLDRLRFQDCSALPAALLGLFGDRLASEDARSARRSRSVGAAADLPWQPHPLVGLVETEDCRGDVPAFAALVRASAPIRSLRLLNPDPRPGEDGCRQIFEGLRHNSSLRSLHVTVESLFGGGGGALVLPADPTSSSLRHLWIGTGGWTEEGIASLARQLKTNTTLVELDIYSLAPRPLDVSPWIEALESYNFTLLSFRLWHTTDGRIAPYLRRNQQIGRALDQLKVYRVSPTVLLPDVLHMVRTLPALLYRFVRIGNVDALCDVLVARQRQQLQVQQQQQQHLHLQVQVQVQVQVPRRSSSNNKRNRRTPPLPRRSLRIKGLRT